MENGHIGGTKKASGVAAGRTVAEGDGKRERRAWSLGKAWDIGERDGFAVAVSGVRVEGWR
jgi:hypothetical protein